MKDKVKEIIIECLKELNEELENDSLNNIDEDTKLYGGSGALDSLALVSLITDIEERVSEEFDKEIVLANEKAMSARTSPFRKVGSLTEYIVELLENE